MKLKRLVIVGENIQEIVIRLETQIIKDLNEGFTSGMDWDLAEVEEE